MKITIFNLKGGVGKTSIALNLALTLDANIITNDDYSFIDLVLPNDCFFVVGKEQKVFPEVNNNLDIIYDLGGWLDDRITRIIKQSDIVIVPIINKISNIVASINSIKEILNIEENKNILIVVNASEKNDLEEVTEIIKKYFQDENIAILELKKTTAFEKMVEYRKSIKKISEENKFLGHSFSKVVKQFDKIIEYLNY